MSTYQPAFDFSGLQNVHGGTFTHVNGDVHNYHIQGDFYSQHSEGLQALSTVIAAGALHDASDRSPPPRCHPETRKSVLKLIMSWIEDPEPLAHDILWLYGPAGCGKSAIMQTISELCRSSNQYLGATFFFSKGKHRRENGHLLFATIAYQLALHVPGLREHVNRAILLEPTLHTKDMSVQLNALIVEPFRRLAMQSAHIYFVIIDGLDECHGYDAQRLIPSLITDALAKFNIPLRFLITSRAEAHIRETFGLPEIDRRTCRIVLDSSYNPDRDIRLFLEEGFEEITRRNTSVLSNVEKPWPTKSVIDHLVEKSSGHFIYPATILAFIGAELHHPIRQLNLVLNPAPATSTPYSHLDQLYTQILDTCPYPHILSRILSLLIVLHCPQPPEVYDDILGLDRGEVESNLRGLHSLVRFPYLEEDERERREFNRRIEYDQTRGLRLHHASFRDYLLDKDRCPANFFVDPDVAQSQLAKSGFKLIADWVSSPWSSENKCHPPHRETWGYLKHHMGTHLENCQSSDRAVIVNDLNCFSIVFPAKAPFYEKIWEHAFDALHALVTTLAMSVTFDVGPNRHHFLNPATFHSEHSHWAQDVTLDTTILSSKDQNPGQKEIVDLYVKYQGILDTFYTAALLSSDDILQILNKLPGFVTQQKPILFDWLEDLFGIDILEISTTLEKNQKFINRWETDFWTRHLAGQDSTDVVLLNPHFSSFLDNPGRARSFYRDPEIRHLLDFRHIINMILNPDWLRVPRQREALVHLDRILRLCLDSISVDPMDDYPHGHCVLGLINVLNQIDYDLPSIQEAPALNVELIWSATRRLLDWIHRQVTKISGPDTGRHGFKRRFIEISDRIYRQILEVDIPEGGLKTVTIRKPFLVAIGADRVTGEPEIPPSYQSPNSDVIQISETLLALHGLRSSLLSFLTKAERAGIMYISAEMYHTQFAEVCLDYCDPSVSDITRDWRTLPSHTEWRFHLVRALPSPKILTKLSSIRLGPWLAEGLPTTDSDAKVKSINAIIKWLAKIPTSSADIQERWKHELILVGKFERRKTMRFRNPTVL